MRHIDVVIRGTATSDGAGVDINRVIGTPQVDNIDPFLLLDEFRNEDPGAYIAGFPPHPHRGFETVTYMLHGRMKHEDSTGQSGLLSDGAVQWMTAGRGIIHSEMPEQTEGMMWGYQLWVNLPASLKMSDPAYQDIPSEDIPEVSSDDGLVRVIAGQYDGTGGAARTQIPILYLDVRLKAGGGFRTAIPGNQNAFVYAYLGEMTGQDASGNDVILPEKSMGVLDGDGEISLRAGDGEARFLVLAGEPIGEPIARMGPFVMNTREELFKAADDYRRGTLTDSP